MELPVGQPPAVAFTVPVQPFGPMATEMEMSTALHATRREEDFLLRQLENNLSFETLEVLTAQ